MGVRCAQPQPVKFDSAQWLDSGKGQDPAAVLAENISTTTPLIRMEGLDRSLMQSPWLASDERGEDLLCIGRRLEIAELRVKNAPASKTRLHL